MLNESESYRGTTDGLLGSLHEKLCLPFVYCCGKVNVEQILASIFDTCLPEQKYDSKQTDLLLR